MQFNVERPLIIAHRGASALAPENTLAAFQKAILGGAEGIEFDVQMAKDGVPVVFHDYDLKRTGRREGKVSDFTSKELQNLDVGTWFNLKNPHRANERFSAETVPTFSGLLDFLKDYKGLLYVEMKFAGKDVSALVEAVCKIIRESRFLPQVKLKSFNLEAIKQAKKLFPEIRTVALFEPKFRTLLRGKLHLIEKAEAFRADELSLHYSLATQKMIERAKARNFPVTIWTADNPAWVKRAINLGLDAIITNNPARLLSEKGKR
ncbi:MAG: glycerophosphodiester phosphodiesterase family protein [Pyrinomonadaceae bacterium]